jgi:hypothetical protein
VAATRWRRRAAGMITSGLLTAGLLLWGAQASLAVHDTGMFELDGNIAHDAGTARPYDWASLFDASGDQLVTPDLNGPLLASGFFGDAAQPDKSYFAASDKDIDGIGTWDCKTQNNVLNKDDLQNAYAAVIKVPADAPDNAGHKVLYLGSERDSNNGDSFAGFWLLKDPTVGCSGTAGFSGHHTDGDILVVSNYTNGGGTHNVQVYEWQGNDLTGAPVALTSFDGAKCGVTAPDNACAIANSGPITSPWTPTSHPTNTFVEAGVDLTAVLNKTGDSCFSTFLAETRSSQEITAELKDFTGGSFNTCPPAPITTTATPGGDAVLPGTPQHDVATVGTADQPATGSVAFFLCGPDEVTAAGCETGGTQVGSDVALTDGAATSDDVDGTTTPNDSADGTYCWRTEYAPDADSEGVYLPSTHTNGGVGGEGAECFVVATPPSSVSSSPSLSTSASSVTTPPPSLSFEPTSAGPVANTGAGPITDELAWAAALIVLGGAAALAGKRRGYRRMH